MARVFRSAGSVWNLRDGSARTDWYRIQGKANAPTQVHIYDEIGMYGVSAGQFISDLDGVSGDIEVHLNSPGGEVFDGIAIYNALRRREPAIVIDSLAASITSVIAQAAAPGRLRMEPSARMMIHDGYALAAGNAAELTKMVELLNEASDTIAGIYAARTGKPLTYWRDKMRDETWYTAEAAVSDGLADGIVGIKNAMGHGHEGECWDGDGDGDCDLAPGGDTDHDYWSADGTQKQDVPGKPMHDEWTDFLIGALREAPLLADGVDSSPWDASKAWHNGASSDDPGAFYKAICAGRRSGDPAVQSSWALPYRYTPSSPPNAAGVRAALGRFDQTQGLTNAAEAKAKLQRLMKQINPDYDPGDLAELFLTGHATLREAQ